MQQIGSGSTDGSPASRERAAPPARLGEVGEDGILAAILPFFPADPSDLVGPGDDAAVVAIGQEAVVVTTDTLVRDRDWRDDWSSAADVGAKAVTQNLADLAAMGAAPRSLVVALVADPATELDWVADLARSIGQTAGDAGATVIGGDLSSAPGGCLMVSVTALGDLQGRRPVLRSGARVGDVLAVTGSLGASEAGLRVLAGADLAPDPRVRLLADRVVEQHRRPRSPLAAGPQAAEAGATAMIDVSDGLSRDAGRVARASGVGVDLRSEALAPDVDRIGPILGERVALECVLDGGEEHSLLATFPSPAVPDGWRVIGRVVPGDGVTLDGAELRPGGWDHFGG